MTSMPASRRARAITFAPRSCPSRPGLATSTRMGVARAVIMATAENTIRNSQETASRLSLALRLTNRLDKQEQSDAQQTSVNIPEKGIATQAMIRNPSKKDGGKRGRQRNQIVMGDGASPQAGIPISGHRNDACGQEISLQGGAEMLGRPAAHRSINDQRGSVHSISAAEHAGEKSATQQPGTAVA